MSESATLQTVGADADQVALGAACHSGVALCTVVGIDGSFSRRLGAQLAVPSRGPAIGSLSDGCLERQLASDVASVSSPEVRRYGANSDNIDFRLPCGGGLDILIDPAPDRARCREAVERLENRLPARLVLPEPSPLSFRNYVPSLRLRVFGEGPEVDALEDLAGAMGIAANLYRRAELSLGRASGLSAPDRWTAVVLLFHDHEWELALLEETLGSDAFYIGAQGGEGARIGRTLDLLGRGVSEERVAQLQSPIGLIPSCKSPQTLALSVLADIVGQYEKLCEAY